MFNILQIQERLKDLPQEALVKEMQQPTGSAPQFLVLSEINRRKRIRDDYQRQEAANIQTVAEEAVTAAGVPATGIMQMSKAMAPKTNMAQNTSAAEAMPTQPTRMAQGGVVKMAEAGQVPMYSPAAAENLKARPGDMSNPIAGNTLNAIAALKVNYPDIYEEFKDNPNELAYIAETMFEPAITPKQTGLDEIETDMTDKAAPFVPRIPMDTSGETRPISPNMTMFNLPIGQFGQMYDELSNKAGTLGVPDYKLQYEPAKPGEYFYKGNSYILEPDGTMYRRGKEKTKGSKGANIPVSDDLKNTIIAENVGRSVIENYGQPPTSNIAPIEKLIADQQEGAPVENITQLIKNSEGKPIEVDPAEIAAAQVTPTPDISGLGDAARAADAQRMMEINKIPERITVPTLPSADMGVDRFSGFGEVLQAPAMEGFTAPEADFAYGPGSPAETAAIREFLAGGGEQGLRGILDSGLDTTRIKEDDLGALANALTTSDDPIRNLVNKRAQEYLQSDLSTPKEEVYGPLIQGNPLEIARYEERSPEYINALSQQLAEQELYKQQIADQKVFDAQDAKIRAEDLIGGKITSDQPEEPVSAAEELATLITGKVKDVQNYLDEKNLRKEADVEREGYEAAAIKAAEMEEADAAEKKKTEEFKKNLTAEVDNVLGLDNKGGSKSGSGATGLEAELAKQLKDMETSREKDKWMALAEAGFKIMTSQSPTLLGAIGEGGVAGAKSMREGKAAYNKDKLTILALQQRIDASKRAASSKGGLTSYQTMMYARSLRSDGEKAIADGKLSGDPYAVARGRAMLEEAQRLYPIGTSDNDTDNRTTVPPQT
jgi:hypothetical protein